MIEYWHPPAPLLDDVLDELREAREMVAYLTRANEALTAEIIAAAGSIKFRGPNPSDPVSNTRQSYPFRTCGFEVVDGVATWFSRTEEPKP